MTTTRPAPGGGFAAHGLGRLPVAAVVRLESERVCWWVLGGAIAVWTALGLALTRGTTFFSDEYTYFIASRGFNLKAILAPHNGHLIAVVRLIYATVFKLFGPDYLVLRLLEVFGIALVAVLFFALARRAVGPAVAIGPSVLLLFLGAAAPQVTLSPLGITHVYCVAAGLGALIALEWRSRPGDLAACALLTVSVATFSIGLAFLVGGAVSVLLRGDRWRRCWIFLVPGVLYLAWLAAPKYTGGVYASSSGVHLSNALLVPNFLANSAAAVADSLTGLGTDFTSANSVGGIGGADVPTSPWGFVVAALALAALVARIKRGTVSPLLWVSLATLLAFWVLIAAVAGLNRYPYSQRYLYAGAVIALITAADALRGVRLSRPVVAGVLAVSLLALGANVSRLVVAGDFLRSNSSSTRAALTAIQIAGNHARHGFFGRPGEYPVVPDQRLFIAAAAVLFAGGPRPYLAAVRRNGSPAFSLAQLRAQPEAVRNQADESLVNLLGLRLLTATPQTVGSCRRVGGPGWHAFTVRPPGIVLGARTPVAVLVRRFAEAHTVRLRSFSSGPLSALRIPPDEAPDPWHVVVGPGPLTVCGFLGGGR